MNKEKYLFFFLLGIVIDSFSSYLSVTFTRVKQIFPYLTVTFQVYIPLCNLEQNKTLRSPSSLTWELEPPALLYLRLQLRYQKCWLSLSSVFPASGTGVQV